MRTKILIALLVFAVLFVFAGVAFAQDDSSAVVVENKTDFNLVFSVVSNLFSLLAGGGSVYLMLKAANRDKPLKDSTEQLLANLVPLSVVETAYKTATSAHQLAQFLAEQFVYPTGVPTAFVDGVRQAAGVVGDVSQFVADVTDGLPNEEAKG